MEGNNDSQIKIPFDPLEDHLQCSICLSIMRGSVLTPCSHRYCFKCLSEWIEREHSCPCCKKELHVNKLYYDIQFDALVEQILLYRDKAEQEHFDKLFNKVTTLPSDDSIVSPFQDTLKKHLKKSMVSIERYFYRLQQEYQQKIRRCQFGVIPEDLKDSVTDPAVIQRQLERDLKESQKLGAEALDKYLTDSIPPLDFLPVKVSLYINDKQLRLPSVVFQPSDRMSDVKTRIVEHLRTLNREISSWTDEGSSIFLMSPLAKRDHYDIEELLSTVSMRDDVSLLGWNSQPVMQHFMYPGCEIVLNKACKLSTDELIKCYVEVFKEKGPQPVDYFSCRECNSNWICKSCALRCHVGHTISLFGPNHTPSWGCCYCAKKKLCKIRNDD